MNRSRATHGRRLSRPRARRALERIYRAAVAAADPARILQDKVRIEKDALVVQTPRGARKFPLTGKVYLIGAGKGADRSAPVWSRLLGRRLEQGLFIVRDRVMRRRLPRIAVAVAGHPLPDDRGLKATRRCLKMLARAGRGDSVIVFFMGGASSLLVAPAEGLTLADKRAATGLLLKSGMAIREMNTVRKHLSAVKGGGLLRAAAPATAITLAFSFLIEHDPSVIGSGPTFPDSTTFEEALRILRRYKLLHRMPAAVVRRLRNGARGKVRETVKPGSALTRGSRYVLLADNRSALIAGKRKSQALGFAASIVTSRLSGDAAEHGRRLAVQLRKLARRRSPAPRCLLLGGETTVTVKGPGLGGRNQEFALASAVELSGGDEIHMLAAATDGSDGPTDAAGAFVDGTTATRARRLGLSPIAALRRNDSYHFFRRLGDLFRPGPTGTNVLDLVIAIIERDRPQIRK